MRVTREQAAENRERIVQVASELFRERGFEIGVVDLMRAAGLTHGGFYGHFASKDELAAEACNRALESALHKWSAAIEKSPDGALSKIVNDYLSAAHRDDPGSGCLVAALGSDSARQAPQIRRVITEGIEALVEKLVRLVPGKSKRVRRRQALSDFSAMVGAVIIARAVDDPDFSKEILDAVSSSLSKRCAGRCAAA